METEWTIFTHDKWNGKELEWKVEWKRNGKFSLMISGMEKNWDVMEFILIF